MKSIASHVINKCGGPAKVAAWIGVSITQVYKYRYPREKGGTGGVIPADHQPKLLAKARANGVDLTPSDFFEEEAA